MENHILIFFFALICLLFMRIINQYSLIQYIKAGNIKYKKLIWYMETKTRSKTKLNGLGIMTKLVIEHINKQIHGGLGKLLN